MVEYEEYAKPKTGGGLFGSLPHMLKTVFAVGGILFGLIGLVLVIFTYLTISPMLATFENMTTTQIDNAVSGLGSAERSFDSISSTVSTLPDITDKMAKLFTDLAPSVESMGSSLGLLANALDALPPSVAIPDTTINSIRSTGTQLSANADQLRGAADIFSDLNSQITNVDSNIKSAKSSVSKVRTDLSKAKTQIRQLFGALGTALLLVSALMCLIFLALISYSITAFF